MKPSMGIMLLEWLVGLTISSRRAEISPLERTEVAQALISNGADLDYSSEICKNTHLMDASNRGRIEIVQILISNGANLDSRNIFHKTAFNMALNDKVRDVFRAWKRTPRSLKFTMLQTKQRSIFPSHF